MAETYHSSKVKGVYSFQLGALAVLSTAVQLLAGGKMLSTITGIPFWCLTIILAAIAYSYSRFSGIKASITTDVVQLGIILLGCALIVPWLLSKAGGIGTVIAGLGAISGNYSSLTSETGLTVFLGFGLPTAIGLISGPFGDQCFWQRTFSIRKDKLGRSFFFGALLFGLVPLAMGMVGYAAAGSGFIANDSSMVNMEFIMSLLPAWVLAPFMMMVLSGLLSTVDSNLCAAASMTTDWQMAGKLENADNIKVSRRVMVALLIVSILIANIPGLTVTYLFLFYGTLRASTLLPTVMTLLGKKLNANGVFAGVVASLCIGLPIFAIGNIANLSTFKTVGSLTTVLLSGIVALVASRKEAKA
jgi:Na+/proline symporter